MKPNDDRSFDENEWTPDERARFDALSSERVPPSGLEARTARELRARGYISGKARVSRRIVVGGLLAASAVFAAGALVGYTAANRRVAPTAPPVATNRAVAQIDSTVSPTTPTRHVVWY